MSDIVERLGDIYATDDHARLCQGREYDCTCGYDERSAATAREAATEITRLRSERDEARALVIEANNSLFGSQGYFHSTNSGDFNRYHLASAIEALKADTGRLRSLVEEAGKEIGWQDIRLAAGEGPLKGRDVFGAVNVILNHRRRSLLDKLKEG